MPLNLKERICSVSPRQWIYTIAILIGVGTLSIILFIFSIYMGIFGPVPSYEELKEISNPIASEIYSADNQLIGRIYLQNRSNVEFDEISKHAIDALVATEDSRFYEHDGIDEKALLRVFVKTIILQQHAGGGSTLSQQIAKNVYGRENHWILSMPINKIKEAITAYRLEKTYNKHEILTLYLNTVPFGDNTYGIETAAQHFFTKHAKELSLNEAAVLIGMLKANTYYNPRLHPDHAYIRKNVVLHQMVKNNYLSQKKYETISEEKILLNLDNGPIITELSGYYKHEIRVQTIKYLASEIRADGRPFNIYTDGLKIYTTINSKMQKMAEESVLDHMSRVQKTFERHWKGRNPWGRDTTILGKALRRSVRYRSLKKNKVSNKEIQKIFRTPIPVQRFTYDGIKEVKISPLDSIKYSIQLLHPSFIAIDPQTSQIKAWVGGPNYKYYPYDHVKAKRQVGSTFKPFVYAAALEQGIDPGKYISNAQETYEKYKNWTPKNAENHYDGYYSMEGALAHSVNTVAVKIMMETGPENVVNLAQNMGIKEPLPKVPSLALGTADCSLLELTSAYTTFANGGMHSDPILISKIDDSEGNTIRTVDSEIPRRVLSSETANIMNHFLEAVVDSGTGRSLRSRYGLRIALAGKTGTTQNGADGWFMGYCPNLVTGAWVGANNPKIHFRTIRYGQGAYLALPIVGTFFKKLTTNSSTRRHYQRDFTPPSRDFMRENEKMSMFSEDGKKRESWLKFGLDLFKMKKDSVEKLEQRPEGSVKPQKKKKRKKKGLWGSIKGLFGKK
ncbi:PBP1A family penicillin-binding protein [Halosquirtibacter laminarini]|uniref:PBP1A family penicillin-binding protein n=1 Tax=Halosquirtibacter laminarini TaxID=3374600 RepID=A0AC61NBA9_9BACT|nr:PBP1A family penicillin-binding protein [Prolixibacteraceae bacterium]